ncbi:50S ribosomal protein L18 [bacterium]|nr:50S ribosomal protein L18 [bacterium]|tara:strand:- start:1289 stop:1639 length:351 start_codon:yes stop_codon:yes gene_type:complete
MTTIKSKVNRQRRHLKVRKKLSGSAKRPRLSVFRSTKHIYAQLIDDTTGRTLAAADDRKLASKLKPVERAAEVGKILAEAASTKKITQVVFDRGGFKFHGRVKAVADSARKAGLKF